MDRPENEQGNRTGSNVGNGGGQAAGNSSEDSGQSKESSDDGVGVTAEWVHGKVLTPNPAVKDLLLALKSGLENMISVENAKLVECLEARKRMGGG